MRDDLPGRRTRASLFAATAYLGTLLVAIAASFAATDLAIGLVNGLPRNTLPNWIGWPLNVLPSMFCAAAAFSLVAFALARQRVFHLGAAAHMARAVSLYLIMFVALALLFAARNNSDLGLFMQALLWPAATAVGGILTDIIAAAALGRLRANAV